MAGVPSIMQAMLDEVAPKLRIGVRMLSEMVRVDAREGDIGMQLGEIAKVSQHGANTNMMLRARDAQKLALAKREVEGMLERAASTIKYRVILALSRRKQGFPSSQLVGRHLQLFSNGRCFRRSVRGHPVSA